MTTQEKLFPKGWEDWSPELLFAYTLAVSIEIKPIENISDWIEKLEASK